MPRSGENSTHSAAAQLPAIPIQRVGRTPSTEPSVPPITAPSGRVPQTIQRMAAFSRPSSPGGQIACR